MFDILLVVLFCLTLSFITGEIFFRLKLPRVVGQIFAGIILSIPLLKSFVLAEGAFSVIQILSEIGIIFLLLLTGLEIDLREFVKYSKSVFLIAFASALIPFFFGVLLTYLLGFSQLFPFAPFIVGACLALTSTGTKAKVLMDFNKLDSRLGQIMLGAGAIDHFIGAILLGVTLFIIQSPNQAQFTLPLFPLVVFIVVILALIKVLPRIIEFISQEHSDASLFTIAIILGLLIALLSEAIGLGTVIGALVAGIILQRAAGETIEHKIVKNLKIVTFGLVIPFFFILIGLHFNLESLLFYPVLAFLVVLVASAGKLLGPILVKPFAQFNLKQANLIGWAMNSRGAIELVIVQIAFLNNLIPVELYSVIIFMVVITTLYFPIALKKALRKNPRIMS